MSETTTPSTVEVSTDLGEYIVRHEHAQKSSEGHSQHNQGTEDARAERDKKTPEDDVAFHDAFLEAIESTKPLLDDKDRVAQEDRDQAKRERAEQAQADKEEEESDDDAEEQKGPNPLQQFAPNDVKAFADQIGLTEEDLENPKIAALLASRMSDQQEATNKVEAPIQQVQDEQRFQQHLDGLHKLSQDPTINDPRMTAAFEVSLAQCFAAESPEQLQNTKNLSSTLIQGGLSLMSTVVPQILANYLPSFIEQYLPGLAENHREATAHNVWQDVRSSDASFRDLPEVDSPEFTELRAKLVAANPWLETITFQDGNKRPLHPDHPQAMRQHALVFARLARGEQFTPETIRKAVETGRREATSHTRKVTASRSLGAGKSKGQFQAPKNDEFVAAIHEFNRAQRSTEE